MNFTQLRAFHAVGSAGGFTRGAARLRLSQPAVTVQVRALEERYGVLLFRRLGQRIELTEFGRELWQRTRRVFAELDDLEELMASAGELRIGRLEIGADGPFSVMDLVAAFIGRHPGVRIAVRIGNAARVRAELHEAQTDLAVLNLIEPDPALHSQALYDDRIVAFVPRGHVFARRRRIGLGELAAAPLILREPGSATRALLLQAMTRARLAPRIALELGSREAVREAVLAGLGVGAVFAKELVRDPRLRAVGVDSPGLGATVSLACLPERRELRAVRAFFALAGGAPPPAGVRWDGGGGTLPTPADPAQAATD
jgi:LysR family transcriptional regulator, low CO2-responsive transcriptional regulator